VLLLRFVVTPPTEASGADLFDRASSLFQLAELPGSTGRRSPCVCSSVARMAAT
jgi:hypothetical protein